MILSIKKMKPVCRDIHIFGIIFMIFIYFCSFLDQFLDISMRFTLSMLDNCTRLYIFAIFQTVITSDEKIII